MSICTHPHMCTHLPVGIHMLLLICMQKICCVFLFVNRKWLDSFPDKGSYSKHTTNSCLCSSCKLISSSSCTCSHGSRYRSCRNATGQAKAACYQPPTREVLHPLGEAYTDHYILHSAGFVWHENCYLPPNVSHAERQDSVVLEPGCLQSGLLYYIQSKLASQQTLH